MNKSLAFIGTFALLISCGKDLTIPADQLIERKDFVLTRADRDIIQANNGFAFDLFRKVAASAAGESILISPFSVTVDFGMINNGTGGETQAEVNRVLGYREGSPEELNAFCRSMLDQSVVVDPSTSLDFANAAVINTTHIPLKESFTTIIRSIYDAEVVYKTFGRDDVMGLINRWCSEKTRGMIPVLLDQQPSSTEYAHFLNAVYFKGIWSSQFKKNDTKKAVFSQEDGSKSTVDMMWQKGKFNYGGIDGICQALCLPYGNQAYRMLILLPMESKTIGDVRACLTSDKWSKLLNGMSGYEVDVKLPVFETESNVLLKKTLKEMGIRRLFDGGDFHGMTDEPQVFVDNVQHKARIKVDETGSEAAAVTDVIFYSGALPGVASTHPIIEFHCNKPFVYAITEVSSGAIYFIGQYAGK